MAGQLKPSSFMSALGAVALSLLCAGGGSSESSPSRSASIRSAPRGFLGECPAVSTGGVRFEVVIGACTKARSCPVQVHLFKGKRKLDSATLKWRSETRTPTPEPVDAVWGAGDPLIGEPSHPAAQTGKESGYLSTLTRCVRLDSGHQGVLVTQRTGFEHLKRQNTVFVAQGERLKRAWQMEEGAGPVWTSVMLVPDGARGGQWLVRVDASRSPDEGESDTLTASAFGWDASRAALVEKAWGTDVPLLSAAVVGGFQSVAEARRVRDEQSECLESFWVLPLVELKGAPLSGAYVLVALSADRTRAESALEHARRCTGNRPGALLSFPVQ